MHGCVCVCGEAEGRHGGCEARGGGGLEVASSPLQSGGILQQAAEREGGSASLHAHPAAHLNEMLMASADGTKPHSQKESTLGRIGESKTSFPDGAM